MTLIVGVLARDFAFAMADRRAVGHNVTIIAAGGQQTHHEDLVIDGMVKLDVADDGVGIVGTAGTFNNHIQHLLSGKPLSGFARDEHIETALRSLAQFAEIPKIPSGAEFTVEHCLHIFREGERFFATVIMASPLSFSRETQRNGQKQLQLFPIGSGRDVWTPMLAMPTVVAEWRSIAERASDVTPEEVFKFLRKVFAVASAVVPDVGATNDAWILHKTGSWQRYVATET